MTQKMGFLGAYYLFDSGYSQLLLWHKPVRQMDVRTPSLSQSHPQLPSGRPPLSQGRPVSDLVLFSKPDVHLAKHDCQMEVHLPILFCSFAVR